MTAATRRKLARISILACIAIVIFSAVAFTVDPHGYPFSAVLRADIPAISGIIFSRLYLHSTAGRRD